MEGIGVRVPGYSRYLGIEATRIWMITRYEGIPGIEGTRVWRVPEYRRYQITIKEDIMVCRIPENRRYLKVPV